MISKDAIRNTSIAEAWLDTQWTTFVKLRLDADIQTVCQKMDDIYANSALPFKASTSLRPLTDIHLSGIDAFVASADEFYERDWFIENKSSQFA